MYPSFFLGREAFVTRFYSLEITRSLTLMWCWIRQFRRQRDTVNNTHILESDEMGGNPSLLQLTVSATTRGHSIWKMLILLCLVHIQLLCFTFFLLHIWELLFTVRFLCHCRPMHHKDSSLLLEDSVYVIFSTPILCLS